MQSTRARVLIVLAAVAIVIVAFVVFSGGSNNDSTGSSMGGTTQTITVKNGQPVGGIAELSYNKGDLIDIVVDYDTASEVHLHGFDVMQDVTAGGTTEFKVPADLEGKVEMELEDTKTQIAEITVNP